MKYRIQIHYLTGDSFKTEEKEVFLDGTWEDEAILRRNIERIKEHNDWYTYSNKNVGRYYTRPRVVVVEPDWHKGKPETSVLFSTDDLVPYWQSAFWCGYFETLYGAKAVAQQEEIGFEY